MADWYKWISVPGEEGFLAQSGGTETGTSAETGTPSVEPAAQGTNPWIIIAGVVIFVALLVVAIRSFSSSGKKPEGEPRAPQKSDKNEEIGIAYRETVDKLEEFSRDDSLAERKRKAAQKQRDPMSYEEARELLQARKAGQITADQRQVEEEEAQDEQPQEQADASTEAEEPKAEEAAEAKAEEATEPKAEEAKAEEAAEARVEEPKAEEVAETKAEDARVEEPKAEEAAETKAEEAAEAKAEEAAEARDEAEEVPALPALESAGLPSLDGGIPSLTDGTEDVDSGWGELDLGSLPLGNLASSGEDSLPGLSAEAPAREEAKEEPEAAPEVTPAEAAPVVAEPAVAEPVVVEPAAAPVVEPEAAEAAPEVAPDVVAEVTERPTVEPAPEVVEAEAAPEVVAPVPESVQAMEEPAEEDFVIRPPSEKEEVRQAAAEAAHRKSLEDGLQKMRGGFVSKLGRLFKSNTRLDEDVIDEIEEVLYTSDIGPRTVQQIMDRVQREIDKDAAADPSRVWDYVRQMTEDLLMTNERPLVIDTSRKPFVLLVVGVNGVGKTTTIGKLATRYRDEGHKVLLVAGDTFRAAAIEQLQEWGQRTGMDVHLGTGEADPASVIFDGVKRGVDEEYDIVICDTAGRLTNKKNLMKELEKINRVAGKAHDGAPHETLLVLDANTGLMAVQQARMFQEVVDISGIVLTKLDGTAKGGVVIGISQELKVPVQFIGIGEGVYDLRKFDAREFVDAMFL